MTADLIAQLAKAGLSNPADELRAILNRLGLRAGAEWSAEDTERLHAVVARRAGREPLGYILKEQGFWSLDLAVSPHVLNPRPDTECLVEAMLKRIDDKAASLRLLDLGTGSGAIMLALLSELPNATGIATDQSPEALAVAEINAHQAGLADRVGFVHTDWAAGLHGPFDLIVSNPPYIESAVIETLEPEVRDHEPRAALDGGPDGLEAYRAILGTIAALCTPGTQLGFEIGFDQATSVGALMVAAGWNPPELVHDYGGNPRVLVSTRAS